MFLVAFAALAVVTVSTRTEAIGKAALAVRHPVVFEALARVFNLGYPVRVAIYERRLERQFADWKRDSTHDLSEIHKTESKMLELESLKEALRRRQNPRFHP